jgi:H+/Cl- antiporter ClcA
MFVPSLAVGAAGGRLVGRLVAWAVHSAGSKLPVSLNAYSVIGALSGFLASICVGVLLGLSSLAAVTAGLEPQEKLKLSRCLLPLLLLLLQVRRPS